MRALERIWLVDGVCGRDEHGVLLRHLGVLEQFLARVLVAEHLDLVLGAAQAADAAVQRREQRLLVALVELAAGAWAGEDLLWQPRLERVLAIHAALLAMVLVVLFEHWQRVRRDDVHRAAGVREGRALGRGLDVAEHDALLGHARVVERVGTAVVVAEQNLVESRVPDDRDDRRAVELELCDALHRFEREESQHGFARALFDGRARDQQALVGRVVAP
mmetsp:Transcript_48613/g.105398  ORF Transcript_48613/g.105398 Transcript_48613/m.105398 type:complete len:219 (+) Transcript_48613:479-1135(+)